MHFQNSPTKNESFLSLAFPQRAGSSCSTGSLSLTIRFRHPPLACGGPKVPSEPGVAVGLDRYRPIPLLRMDKNPTDFHLLSTYARSRQTVPHLSSTGRIIRCCGCTQNQQMFFASEKSNLVFARQTQPPVHTDPSGVRGLRSDPAM
jgi:hypothetical protein